jgi:hypothetical protein
VAVSEQLGHEAATHVSGRAGDEDTASAV